MALVLVVWLLLWPEGSGPALIEDRNAWQRSVQEAERRRATLEAERAGKRGVKPENEPRVAAVEPPVEPARRRIARPSELADRLDAFGWRPGQVFAGEAFKPAPKRPTDFGTPAIDADVLLQADLTSGEGSDEPASPPDSVQAALDQMIDGLQTDRSTSDVDGDGSLLEVAVLSTESLDAEPLPEVDLSDLDTLVPLDPAERSSVAPLEPPVAEQPPASPSSDEVVEAFAQGGAEAPITDVRERPRDDAPTWLNNAVNAAVDDERPIVAIVIDDLGLNRPNTAAFNELPAPLTLAFLPYAGRIEAQAEAAHAAGHELMVHLPMEPFGSDWPGPDALTTKIDRKEFTSRLEKNLNRFKGFVGVNNHMGSRLTADRSRMNVVMRELRDRDVLFLDSKTSARSVASDVAGQSGVPNTSRDVFLDHVIDLGAIRRQLARVERVARQSGSAVAIGHPHGVTIQALREWLPTLEARGFVLAPISAVVARRACGSGVLIAAETCGRYLQARTPTSAVVAKDG